MRRGATAVFFPLDFLPRIFGILKIAQIGADADFEAGKVVRAWREPTACRPVGFERNWDCGFGFGLGRNFGGLRLATRALFVGQMGSNQKVSNHFMFLF